MVNPEYQELQSQDIPIGEQNGVRVKGNLRVYFGQLLQFIQFQSLLENL